jgi:hypothetical protein
MGGASAEDKVWIDVLTRLASRWGIENRVEVSKACVDPNVQWSQWTNVWRNAMIRTTLYLMASPIRWVRRQA